MAKEPPSASESQLSPNVKEALEALGKSKWLSKRAIRRHEEALQQTQEALSAVTGLVSGIQSLVNERDVIVSRALGVVAFYDLLATATFVAQRLVGDPEKPDEIIGFIEAIYSIFSDTARLDPAVQEGFSGAMESHLPNYLEQIRNSSPLEGFSIGLSMDHLETVQSIIIGDPAA